MTVGEFRKFLKKFNQEDEIAFQNHRLVEAHGDDYDVLEFIDTDSELKPRFEVVPSRSKDGMAFLETIVFYIC